MYALNERYQQSRHLLTIGQLAAYAGVTVRAVRHYHQRGLLEEPQRDGSGYRRYSARHAIDLVKIRTLGEAGVPLARVKELLDADPDAFAAAIVEIDRDLRERARRLREASERVRRLRGGDRLFVPPEIADHLEDLAAIGVSRRAVEMERDVWILASSVSPEDTATLLAGRLEAIADPEFRAIYLEYDAAYNWAPDDPRLEALAERTVRWSAGRQAQLGKGPRSLRDPAIVRILAPLSAPSPAWRRLAEMARQRAAEATPPG